MGSHLHFNYREHWDASLWGKLGFSYEQLHSGGCVCVRAGGMRARLTPRAARAAAALRYDTAAPVAS